MARVALLIGTGEYSPGLERLPAASRDVAALETVLSDSEMGGFDQVQTLINRQHTEIAEAIETWFRQHTAGDLALLYISGHGVKDIQLDLYFAACNTRKVQEELVRSTAVAARFVHDCSRRSKAKRQVIILDCCFSGAYGNLLPRDDGTVNLEAILGQEGRVVLTSSSSAQYSFEQRNEELSIYTHHLVEGIRTGAADLDGDGAISVGELHQYASQNVQEASPAMNPKIIVLKDEGYLICIAKAPLGDLRVKYRKEVGAIAEEDEGEISSINRDCLEELQQQFGLTDDEAKQIEFEVLEPYRQRQAKIDRYRKSFTQVIEQHPQLRDKDRTALKRLQRILGFRDEDVKEIEEAVKVQEFEQAPKATPEDVVDATDNFRFEQNIDYTQLRDLLKTQNWRESNEETLRLLLVIANREAQGWLNIYSIRQLPIDALQEINQIWVEASQGRFGFSTQTQLYREICVTSPANAEKAWNKFDHAVKWRSQDEQGRWINGQDFSSSASNGHLPNWRKLMKPGWGVTDRALAMLNRFLAFSTDPTGVALESYQTTGEQQLSEDVLSSEKDIDYTQLRDLLGAGDWEAADQETYRTMIRAVGREEGDNFSPEDLLNVPCADIQTIDRLWVKYSNGKFGFSVQKKIYIECGGKTDGKYPSHGIWHKFCDRVGWREDAQWIDYSAVIFNTSAPNGHLPVRVFGKGVRLVPFLGWMGVGWDEEVSLFSHRDL